MISVIIPTVTGGFEHLAKLLPDLSAEIQNLHGEIIVIDNNSMDGTANFLSNFACTVIHNKERRSFSKSMNQGTKIAQFPHILYLNNDVRIVRGFAKKMLNTFSKDPNCGIVGCKIWRERDKKLQHAGVYFTDIGAPYELGLPIDGFSTGLNGNDPRSFSIREVPSVTACCMLVKREVWDRNNFDEEYINGWEDTDFVLKARESGYTVWYNGQAEIYHVHMGSRSVGRLAFESQNRARYDSVWINTRRVHEALRNYTSME